MVAKLYMYRLRYPKMYSQTKFEIPRIYARDTIFLDLDIDINIEDLFYVEYTYNK